MSIIVGGRVVNARVLEAKLTAAFATWANDDINDSYWDDFFKDDRWSYPGETKRKNGEVVDTPRNIYDLGSLYDSGRESFTLNLVGNLPNASWNWDARNESGRAYAWYVHEGLSTNLAPRPWTDAFQVPAKFERGVAMRALKNRIRQAFMK
jgi:hypothetical protein